MESIICDISAFNFWRIPPSVLTLFEEPPTFINPAYRRLIDKDPVIKNLFGLPLHTLVFSRNNQAHSQNVKQHLWTVELPTGSMRDIDNLGAVTSPELTLFTLARSRTVGEAAMAIYEMCGGYSCYSMPSEVKRMRAAANNELMFYDSKSIGDVYSILDDDAGWHQVFDFNRQPIDLWTRPALTTIEELAAFVAEVQGATGAKVFRRALSMVKGYALSPLEARAALMLGVSRRLGGYGFDLKLNQKIDFSKRAKRISGHQFAIADLLITSPSGDRCVDVECQGSVIHTGNKAGVDDARRSAAIEAMGISVVPITYEQLASKTRLEAVVELIHQKLGTKIKPKSDAMKKAEDRLRYEIFVLWD